MEAVYIAGSFVIAELFHSLSTTCSHKATFAVLSNIRKSCCDKLAKVPLGYVKDTPSGSFKNIMVERIDSIETTLAHVVPEFTSNLLVPVIILIYFFYDRLETGSVVICTCNYWIFIVFWNDDRLSAKL